ncbi:TSUP family transporter [Nocardia tengchongensis]|uniref:TSUP family transporter n=1 Tax=Nocardia tengchongensis TaxID=2055889 RepID=UPI0036B3E179
MTVWLGLAVFAGAALQRMTGLGFALVAAPMLVLLAGPFQGIVLANSLALIVAMVVLAMTWRDVDIDKLVRLAPAGVLGVFPGAIVAQLLPGGPLQVFVGSMILLGLGSVLLVARARFAPSLMTTVGTGLVSGFMTATAGVGGPALTTYAVATRWDQKAFAATSQCCFAAQAVAALSLKGLPAIPAVGLSMLLGALLGGLLVGNYLAPWVGAALARQVVVMLALLGALGTVVRGVVAWSA